MEVNEIIAINLKRIRQEKNLSLGQLAELAGVSKMILSQLEKGASNPTINTIWKISAALQVSYSDLLELPEMDVIHVRKEDIHPLHEDKYHIFPYYKRDSNRNFELYQIELDPGCCHSAVGHFTESTEYIIVVTGQMELEASGQVHTLYKDEGLCFDASGPHSYRNSQDTPAKAVLMITYGNS